MQSLPFPAALYTFILRRSPLVLVFPLVVSIPFVLQAGGELSHRFLTYARPRMNLRAVVGVRLVANVVVASPVAFIMGIIPQFLVVFAGSTRYRPEAYGLSSVQQIAVAEQKWSTLSQFQTWNAWGLPLAFSVWLAINGALYATLAYVATVLIDHRMAGLSLPWVGSLVVSFLMAAVGWEALSPGLLFPFNLQQLPVENLLSPLLMLLGVTAGLASWMMWRAPDLPAFQ